MKTIKKSCTILFIIYIEVTFLILQHKIKHTDVSAIGFKTVNPLKTIGKLILFYHFFSELMLITIKIIIMASVVTMVDCEMGD